MTARRKGKGRKLPRPKPNLPTLDISRQEIARRELSAAYQMLIAGGDPIAIYVLTMAAFHVCDGEANRLKRPTPWRTYLEQVPEEYRDDYADIMIGHFNVMKHGGKGGLENFIPDAVHIYMLLAMAGFWAVFDEEPAELRDLVNWAKTHPIVELRIGVAPETTKARAGEPERA